VKFFNKQKGNKGEELAVEYLKNQGFKIISTNYSIKWGEIDIIASKDKVLSFVEVKLKTGESYGSPESMINAGKIKKIKRIAELFLEKNSRVARNHDIYRIDVIAIVLMQEGNTGDVASVNFYENVGSEFT